MKAEMNGVSRSWLRTKGLPQLNLNFYDTIIINKAQPDR